MVSAREVDGTKLVNKLAEKLKEQMEMPEWAKYVKTGVSRERPPEDYAWWFKRAASILRRIYLNGPVGVNRLRSYYGGRQRRGHKPPHFKKASGKIIRTILQDLEKLGYLEKVVIKSSKGEVVKGRKITPKGQSFVDKVAKEVV